MRRLLLPALLLALGCTDSSLYALNGGGQHPPDRVDLAGTVCAPVAAGKFFPVRVLFLFVGGQGVSSDIRDAFTSAAQSVTGRSTNPSILYGMGAFHSTAQGEVDQGFGDAAALDLALTRYASFTETGPISLKAPLSLAEALLSGDMIGQCAGTLARTRYLVILVHDRADATCDPTTAPAECVQNGVCSASCVLGEQAQAIRDLQRRYGAGQVTVQPIYIHDAVDPEARAQSQAIALAGGTRPLETSTNAGAIAAAMGNLDYASLQRKMTLKALIAFNRNAAVRNGQVVPDSDGDGLSDDEESVLGTDPGNADTDGDGLQDGLEVSVGLDPKTPTTIGDCDAFRDFDKDGLTDCEERVLGTDFCTGDTDNDAVPDGVEQGFGTNPLQPEEAKDDDHDGFTNLDEIKAHTDPHSSDLAFHADHSYGYTIADAAPTVDGRACYDFQVTNIQLVHTLASTDGERAAGDNDIALYFAVAPEDDPNAVGIQRLVVTTVNFSKDDKRTPGDAVIHIDDADFELKP